MNSVTIDSSKLHLATSTTSAGSSFPDVPVGICGLCAGKVTVPQSWCGTVSPIPTCSKCGATERQKPSCLPVLDMELTCARTAATSKERFEDCTTPPLGGFPKITPSPQTLLGASACRQVDLLSEYYIDGSSLDLPPVSAPPSTFWD